METLNAQSRVRSLSRISCFVYSLFKAFVTLHNDMILQQTHRNNDEVRRERRGVNRQVKWGTDMRAPGSSQRL